MTDQDADIEKMPFETALAELESIVDRLEKGSVALEESIKLYERGETLKARCDALLKDAKCGSRKSRFPPTANPRASRRWTASEPGQQSVRLP